MDTVIVANEVGQGCMPCSCVLVEAFISTAADVKQGSLDTGSFPDAKSVCRKTNQGESSQAGKVESTVEPTSLGGSLHYGAETASEFS